MRPPVDAHLLLAGERRLVVLTNNGAQASAVSVGIAYSHAAELLQGSPLTLAEDRLSFVIELAAWGGAVVVLD